MVIKKIKIIRKTESGPAQGSIFEAREVGLFGTRYQILTDGEFLGEFVDWLDVVEVGGSPQFADNPQRHISKLQSLKESEV